MELSVKVNALASLTLGKSPVYPFERRLDGPHSWSGCCGAFQHSVQQMSGNHHDCCLVFNEMLMRPYTSIRRFAVLRILIF
jgi:hypothetical protein